MELTATQQAASLAGACAFLYGPAGSGKTTALRRRLLHLLQEGEPAYTIMVLVAEAEQREAFVDFLYREEVGPYADLQITTYTSLARKMVELFWPLVARPAGFARPFQPPSSLNYDLAQLLMWRIIDPLLGAGAFTGLRLRPQQIVSQLIDILNRAALNRLSLDEAIARTATTWSGEREEIRYLQDAQLAVHRFRNHCLQHGLLDLSLTVRVFDTQLVEHVEFHRYFSERFRHLIVDNVEEQTPAGQLFVQSLARKGASTTIAYDEGGGFKWMLSADPLGARMFLSSSDETFLFEESFTATEPLSLLANLVERFLQVGDPGGRALSSGALANDRYRAAEAIIDVAHGRYRRENITRLPEIVHDLITQRHVAAHDIVIVAPYLDGALRYTLEQSLSAASIPYYLLRRRSSPRDEPRIRAWLTWLALAHPHWGLPPNSYDVSEALSLSIAGLDPARAQLLTKALYDSEQGVLMPAVSLAPEISARLDAGVIEVVEILRLWLNSQGGQHPLDVFLHLLFTELLALPPFQPEPDLAAAAVCDWLVRTAGNLRRNARALELNTPAELGPAFINGIYQGLVTADPPDLGEPPDTDGVMISTIHGFLLSGRVARVQVWLDVKGSGWWDIPRQPISNVFVLQPDWSPERTWTMDEDYRARNQLLGRLVRGLTARCTDGIILAVSDLDQRGQRQDGILWRAIRPLMAREAIPPDTMAEEL